MKKIYKKHIILTGVAVAGMLSLQYSTGPANSGISATGASFSTYTSGCTGGGACHGGGSYAPTASIQLLSNGVPVTTKYVAGWNYTLRITRTANATHSAIATAGFGFQVTCATASNANVNTWGTPPAGTANRLLSSHNYIEHTAKISKTVFSVDIPWTGAAQSTGAVTFYLALNTVDGTGSTNNDQPVLTSAAFSQAALPVTWLYFHGKENNGNVLLEWATANESNNKFFRIERSSDGNNFESIGEVPSVQNTETGHTYTFADARPVNNGYYRIRQTDLNGNTSYFNTIQVKTTDANTVWHTVNNDHITVCMNRNDASVMTICLYNLEGKKIAQQQFNCINGTNMFSMEKPTVPGMYILTVANEQEKIYFNKLIVN